MPISAIVSESNSNNLDAKIWSHLDPASPGNPMYAIHYDLRGQALLPGSRMTNLRELQKELEDFAARRDWDQFHTPENLAASLVVESSELLEIFNWSLSQDASSKQELVTRSRQRISDELADVFLIALRLADVLQIDLVDAAETKLRKNAEKYPIEKARGRNLKYTELDD